MKKSLISNEPECVVCGQTQCLHIHHIFEGVGRRKKSDQDGCWCYLCPKHHNMSNQGVHFNKKLDLKLKKECQEKWQEKYGTKEQFIKRYGRSYL